MNTNKDKKQNEQKPLSRQRQWQLAKLEEGLCSICGENPIGSSTCMCDDCLEKKRIRQRELRGFLPGHESGMGRKAFTKEKEERTSGE